VAFGIMMKHFLFSVCAEVGISSVVEDALIWVIFRAYRKGGLAQLFARSRNSKNLFSLQQDRALRNNSEV